MNDPANNSMIINSPNDEEVQYSADRAYTKETIIVQERAT